MDNESGLKIIRVLACVLRKLCDNNIDKPVDTTKVTKFHALRPPSISVREYLERIYKYAACSAECYVLALIYIDRLIQRSNFIVSALNVHRVVITSVTLAAKFFDDQFFDNAYYARVGGVPKSEMNSMELDFLFLINFSLFVSPSVYTTYYTELMNHATNPSIECDNCGDGMPTVATFGGSESAPSTATFDGIKSGMEVESPSPSNSHNEFSRSKNIAVPMPRTSNTFV